MNSDGTAGSGSGGLLRGIDRAAFAVALGHRLRSAGVAADLTAITSLVDALGLAAPNTRADMYWACRITLVRRHDELAVFDEVFAAVFADAVLALDPHARRRPLQEPPLRPEDRFHGSSHGEGAAGSATQLPWATLPAVVSAADTADRVDVAMPMRMPTDASHLADTPFTAFDQHDLELLELTLTRMARRRPRRRTRRTTVGRTGRRIGLRATMARSRRTGFEPAELMMLRPRFRPRRIVMICDVSASMQAYSAAYLHLMRVLVRSTDAEVFAFATRLTRLTAALSHRSPTEAIVGATAAVGDRFGGTRIGGSLHELATGPYRDLLRGAIILIGSDGWDADEPEVLARAMDRLQRRAHQVLWINPRAGVSGFRPTVAGMAAALPHCDRLLAGATTADLVEVLAVLCDGEAV